MTEGEGTEQDLDSESQARAENVQVGRDFTQNIESNQHAKSDPSKFPIDDPKDQGLWVGFFDALLTILPLDTTQADTTFKLIMYGSWIVGIGSLASLAELSRPIAVVVPFDAPLFVLAVMGGIITGRYFATRDATDCPNCGSSFALNTIEAFEYPELSDEKKRRGERTVACEVCDYEDTERISWEPSDE